MASEKMVKLVNLLGDTIKEISVEMKKGTASNEVNDYSFCGLCDDDLYDYDDEDYDYNYDDYDDDDDDYGYCMCPYFDLYDNDLTNHCDMDGDCFIYIGENEDDSDCLSCEDLGLYDDDDYDEDCDYDDDDEDYDYNYDDYDDYDDDDDDDDEDSLLNILNYLENAVVKIKLA